MGQPWDKLGTWGKMMATDRALIILTVERNCKPTKDLAYSKADALQDRDKARIGPQVVPFVIDF
jgi:hypothetical protein